MSSYVPAEGFLSQASFIIVGEQPGRFEALKRRLHRPAGEVLRGLHDSCWDQLQRLLLDQRREGLRRPITAYIDMTGSHASGGSGQGP